MKKGDILMPERFLSRGRIPAVLVPFDSKLQIDEPAHRIHLHDMIAVDGVTALTVNAPSRDAHAREFDEKERVLDITLDLNGVKVLSFCGVYADWGKMFAGFSQHGPDQGGLLEG